MNPKKNQKKPRLFSRRSFIYTGVAGIAGSTAYAHWVEPNQLSITKQDILLPNLPPSLDGLVIAQLTDFHFNPEKDQELIQNAVDVVNREKVDLIFLTGDYMTSTISVLPPLMETLGKLSSKHGVYGVMGNHDGWHGDIFIFRKLFQQHGFDFLVNQGTSLRIDSEELFLLGTDSIWSGTVNLESAYRGHSNQPVLALVHEPDVFDQVRKNHRVDLQLSGHTHGGQCRVPLIGYAPVKVRYGRNYLYGHYQRNDASLFVSRGLGTVGRRVRFACQPEVALLTLRSGKI